MKAVKFIYQNQEVDFTPAGSKDIMVNATQMADIFGRETKDFNKLESTKRFINACILSEESSLINIKCKEDLTISKQKSGTWMHRILALKFAAWLDPQFELWVFSTIDQLINNEFREQKDAITRKMQLKAQKEQKKKELIERFPEAAEYFEIESQIKQAHSKQLSAIKNQMNQLKIQFGE
jgi:hypothetical protein